MVNILKFVFKTFIYISSVRTAISYHVEPRRVFKVSQSIPGTSIEYQETSICETTPNVSSYSGYVHLSVDSIPDLQGSEPYNISTFFWYFSARKNHETAPLAIYLAGGPGESSTYAAFGENGPCYANKDGNSTRLNEFSFNKEVNMLYIDQPNQVGFSYDKIIDGALEVISGVIYPGDTEANMTMVPGKFPTQTPNATANTTGLAAKAMWHFMQVWLANFEEYHGPEDTVSVWGNSAGGDWTLGTFRYFLDQNDRIANGTLCNSTYRIINFDTLGITNGHIDFEAQASSYVTYPNNNTYGVNLYNETVYDKTLETLNGPDGCLANIRRCRAFQVEGDPGTVATNATVNEFCASAFGDCFQNIITPFQSITGRSQFDISAPAANPFPPMYAVTYLNQNWVKEALGVPGCLNFTQNSMLIQNLFFETGDYALRRIDDMNALLESGVKLALVYGDRDWKCNWVGAENVSLSALYSSAQSFRSAGYTPILPAFAIGSDVLSTADPSAVGVTRQFETFSFSRVFDAGHAVSFDKPSVVLSIFNRAMFSKDVATGKFFTGRGSGYSSTGPGDSWGWENQFQEWIVETECTIWNVAGSCSEVQTAALAGGNATIENYIIIDPAS